MSYIYKVFEHLKQLWMGIWPHIHTVTTTEVSPDLGKFSEILDDVNVEVITLRYRWGCRTFQTASHIDKDNVDDNYDRDINDDHDDHNNDDRDNSSNHDNDTTSL